MANPEAVQPDDNHTSAQINPFLLAALMHDIAKNPIYYDEKFHDQNEEQHPLILAAVVEANRTANGDITLQQQFVRGAQFALAAFQRQADTRELTKLFS